MSTEKKKKRVKSVVSMDLRPLWSKIIVSIKSLGKCISKDRKSWTEWGAQIHEFQGGSVSYKLQCTCEIGHWSEQRRKSLEIRDQDCENQVFDKLYFWTTKSLGMMGKSWHGDGESTRSKGVHCMGRNDQKVRRTDLWEGRRVCK